MNALQYRIVKSVIAIGADPITFSKMCKADAMDFIKVQTTDNFKQYQEDDSTAMDDIISPVTDALFGKGKKR